MTRSSRMLGVLVLQLALATAAVAQTTGSVRGQIKDQDGNPLPGVTVTATNVGRGTTRTVVSGETGSYALSLTLGRQLHRFRDARRIPRSVDRERSGRD